MEIESPSQSPAPRRRRSSSGSSANSPEFDFWQKQNLNNTPQPSDDLHSADELFSDGFLLPLRFLSLGPLPRPEPDPDPWASSSSNGPDPRPVERGGGGEGRVPTSIAPSDGWGPGPDPGPEPDGGQNPAAITSSSSMLTSSKRWKEIFRRGVGGGERKPNAPEGEKPEVSNRRREKNPSELNINIWPFSRSRSAGNGSARSKPAAQATRKVSSAPCSRSNSSGERRREKASAGGPPARGRVTWPGSPVRAGVHVGRASPVWPGPRRGRKEGKGRVLNLNMPMCMGYQYNQQHRESLGCRNDENGAAVAGGGSGVGSKTGGVNGHFLGLRGLFGKKSVVTV